MIEMSDRTVWIDTVNMMCNPAAVYGGMLYGYDPIPAEERI